MLAWRLFVCHVSIYTLPWWHQWCGVCLSVSCVENTPKCNRTNCILAWRSSLGLPHVGRHRTYWWWWWWFSLFSKVWILEAGRWWRGHQPWSSRCRWEVSQAAAQSLGWTSKLNEILRKLSWPKINRNLKGKMHLYWVVVISVYCLCCKILVLTLHFVGGTIWCESRSRSIFVFSLTGNKLHRF